LPIIRITKAQIDKANKAREAALLKDPEFRAFDERQQLRRQAALNQKAQIEEANKARMSTPPNDPRSRPCDERKRQRETVATDMEQDS